MKKRIYEIARETGLSNQDLLQAAQKLKLPVTTASSGLDEADEARLLAHFEKPNKKKVVKVKSLAVASPSATKQARRPFSLEQYEKKVKQKAKPPKVKVVTPQKANRLFVTCLVLGGLFFVGLGALGIASDLFVAQFVQDKSSVIGQLEHDNSVQKRQIQVLEEGRK